VRCRIFKASLNDVPEYRALSYTWGDMILDQKLIVCEDLASNEGSAVLYITKQLQLALVRFQSQPQWKYLWIDQICINQKDLDERSAQVLLMKQIYQSSLQTIMWLGEPTDPEDLPLIAELVRFLDANELSEERLLDGVPQMRAKRPVAWDTTDDRKSQVQGVHDQHILKDKIDVSGTHHNTVEAQRHKAVMNIFNQSYFRRAWVVQEILVSRELRVLYGELDIPFKSLDRLGVAILEIEISALGWLKALHNTTRGYGGFEYLTKYKRNENQDGRSEDEFLEFLGGMQSHFESSDPRDKIYSFLGLRAENAAPDIKPDYAKPVAEVFADCALSFIEKMKSLTILSRVEGNDIWNCHCSFPIPNLPSCSLNWCQYFHGVGAIEAANVKIAFRSARSRPHERLRLNLLPMLSLPVRGKVVGTVRRVLSQNFDNRNS
jgi:Heterokaryon incompatibility protein (HET)